MPILVESIKAGSQGVRLQVSYYELLDEEKTPSTAVNGLRSRKSAFRRKGIQVEACDVRLN